MLVLVGTGTGKTETLPGGSRASHHRNLAITRGMRRVTISHCAFRRGYTDPVLPNRDMPHGHACGVGCARSGKLRSQILLEAADAAGMLRRF